MVTTMAPSPVATHDAYRMKGDVPRWYLAVRDFLIVSPVTPEVTEGALCLAEVEGEGVHLCKVRRVDPDTVSVETADGRYYHRPDTSVRVVGVVTGVIRKY